LDGAVADWRSIGWDWGGVWAFYYAKEKHVLSVGGGKGAGESFRQEWRGF